MQKTSFQQYLADLPLLHSWDQGKTWNTGGFVAKQLETFHRRAGGSTGGLSIIETGAGNSTITFLHAKPAKLISIAPAEALFGRIHDYCAKNGLDETPLQAVLDRSEVVLPNIARQEVDAGRRYDVGLLDGGHGWPTVFVDFCYINILLRKGGILWIDDVQLHSVKELARLLTLQPGFRLVEDLGKVLAFEKLTDEALLPDFGAQPYIVERTSQYEKYEKSENKFAR